VEHMHTPLVLWGWAPSDGRAPVPVAQEEFLAKVREWADKGAACPAGASAGMAPDIRAIETRTHQPKKD
jgi:hypothetical protein